MLDFVLKRRQSFFVLILFIFGLAIFIIPFMPVELYPPISKPTITVRLPHQGISAVEFYENYWEEIEPVLAKVEGVDVVTASYRNNISLFTLSFNWSETAKQAQSNTENSVSLFISKLPIYTQENYSIYENGSGGDGFFALSFYSNNLVPEELYQRVKTYLYPKINKIKGVESLSLSRTDSLEVSITFRPLDLWRYNMTLGEIASALKDKIAKSSLSGGTIGSGTDALIVLLQRGTQDPYSLSEIILAYREGVPIFLSNVADIEVHRALPTQLNRLNGLDSIVLFVTPEEGENLNNLSYKIKKTIEDLQKAEKEFEDISSYFIINPEEFISKAVGNVLSSGFMGAILSIIIVYLFLGEFRNTFIIAISIPLAILIAFIFMFFLGKRINLISLGGLTLSMGMVIDSSIVVVENMYRLREENPKWSLIKVIKQAVGQVQFSLLASTLTTVLVFLPLPFTSPLTSAILGDLAFTVIFSLIGSLLVALYVNPFLFYYLFKKGKKIPKPSKMSLWSSSFRSFLQKKYTNWLSPFIYNSFVKIIFIIFSFVFLFLTFFFIFPRIDSELMAKPTSNRVVLNIKFSQKMDDLMELSHFFEQIERRLEVVLGDTPADIYSRLWNNDSIQSIITLPSSRYSVEILDKMKSEFQDDNDFTFSAFEWDPASLPLPEVEDLEINLIGSDPKILADLMNDIRDLIYREDLYQSVRRSPNVSPVVRLELDPRDAILKELNIDVSTLMSTINRANSSIARLELFDEESLEFFQIDVRLEEFNSKEDLMNYFYPYKGNYYPMRHFFNYHYDTNLSQILSIDEDLTFSVLARLSLENKGKRVALEKQMEQLIKENISFPEGYSFEFRDTQEAITEATQSLMIAFALSVSIVFVVLAIQFNSILYPTLIMATVPLGVIGVILSLWLFSSTISLNSLLGLILLGGIVVNNAILIIDFYLELVPHEKDYRQAIIKASQLRLIPILITSSTTVLGMIPIAMALGDGTNVIQPLGIAVSGGLLVSTTFTLFMIPTLLSFFPYKEIKEHE